jgi:hypothetical protein
MKISSACRLFLCAILPAGTAMAVQVPPPHVTNGVPKQHASSTTGTPAPEAKKPESPAPVVAATTAAAPSPSLTLDGYIADLADQVPLSKSEQTDIKTYYLDDGAKLQTILNDASLSPLAQQQQVDDLRDARNGKIEALLADDGRQTVFLKMEGTYRVALVQLAAQGGLVPTTPPPNVPQPTATPPADAGKTDPNSPRADAAQGQ